MKTPAQIRLTALPGVAPPLLPNKIGRAILQNG